VSDRFLERAAHGWIPYTRSAAQAAGSGNGKAESLIERGRAMPLGYGRNGTPTKIKGFGSDSLAELLVSSLNMSGAEELSNPYEESKWVHACIRALSTAMLQAPLRFYYGDPLTATDAEGSTEVPTTHPLYKLFGMPSTHQTGMQFREANLVHRKLDGETIWFLMDVEGKPVAQSERSRKITIPTTIIPVRGNAVEIKMDQRGLPGLYVYPSKARIEFPAASVVHFRDYDPNNPMRGLGDVEVLMRDLATEFQAQRYQEGLLGNGGDPGGWIINNGSMSEPKRRAEQAAINDRYGNVERAGEWQVMSGKDVKVVPNNMKPKDMQYMDLRSYVFNAVCAILGVPTILLGDTSSATFSNFEQAMQQLWTGPNGIISYLRSEEDTFKAFFLNRLDLPDAERIWMRYDLSVVTELKEDTADSVKIAAEIAAQGIGVSFNDAAAALGVDTSDVETGDLRLLDGKYKPVESLHAEPVGDEPAAPAKPDVDDAKSMSEAITLDEILDAADAIEIERQAYVRAVFSVVQPHEDKLRDAMRKYLRKYELSQIKRLDTFASTGKGLGPVQRAFDALTSKGFDVADLTAKDLKRLLLDPEEWSDKLFDSSAPMLEASFSASLGSVESQIGVTGLTMQDPAVIEFLERQGVQLADGVGGVNGTLSRKVEKALLRVFSEESGTTVNSLQEAVRELLPKLKGSLKQAFVDRDSRALTIAQTESGKAASGARYMAMEKSEVVEKHEWVTAGDGEVRDSHAALNGMIVPIGEEFKSGLRYPMDPNGAPEEVINCRCVAAPVIEGK